MTGSESDKAVCRLQATGYPRKYTGELLGLGVLGPIVRRTTETCTFEVKSHLTTDVYSQTSIVISTS